MHASDPHSCKRHLRGRALSTLPSAAGLDQKGRDRTHRPIVVLWELGSTKDISTGVSSAGANSACRRHVPTRIGEHVLVQGEGM